MTEKSTTTARPPAGLGKRGRAFWRQILTDYELSGAETHLLEEVCRCLDRLDLLDVRIAEDGPMTLGSQGQQVVNPALTEARQQQTVLRQLVASLGLPDDDTGSNSAASIASSNARRAAKARWSGVPTEAARRRNAGR